MLKHDGTSDSADKPDVPPGEDTEEVVSKMAPIRLESLFIFTKLNRVWGRRFLKVAPILRFRQFLHHCLAELFHRPHRFWVRSRFSPIF